MKLKSLAELFYIANSGCTDKKFYEIKNEFLKNYGTFIGFDTQFIHGQQCYTCGGSGEYLPNVPCYNCNKGWYKEPFYTFLEVYEIYDRRFHLPYKKVINPSQKIPFTIEGYINKTWTTQVEMALEVIYQLHSNGILFQNIT